MSTIVVHRKHQLIPVKEHPQKEIKKLKKKWDRTDPDRDVGVEEASLTVSKELPTVFIALDFQDARHNIILDTRGLEYPIEAVMNYLESICDDKGNPIYAERITNQTQINPREPKERLDPNNGGKRPGRRKLPKQIILIAHNWELLLGRLFRNNSQFRKTVRAGENGITINVGDWELEVLQLTPGGSGCSFKILARKYNGEYMYGMMLVGRSIKGQLSTTMPIENAAAYLDRHDLEPLPDKWKKRQISSFTQDEIEYIKSYVATSANFARLIYNQIIESDRAISPYVTRRDGTHPSSAAGVATRIALSMLEVDKFERPNPRVQQIGALSVAGGRVFQNIRPGYYENLYLYDGILWYGHIMGQLPSPATCEYLDIEPGSFDIHKWIGQYGSMLISGIPHSDRNHALRVHDPERKRLYYLDKPFTHLWFPIPDIVYGVVSNRLTVTHIHDGIHIVGSNKRSFLREFAFRMNELKEQQVEGSPLYKRIKNLVHVIPGKMTQINTGHPYIDKLARGVLMPIDSGRGYEHQRDATLDLLSAYARGIQDLRAVADGMYAHSKYQDRELTFGEFLDTHLSPNARTGALYLPAHGSNILGEASARLGLLATTTNAISGYTDSIITFGDEREGITRYNELVRMAGYNAPEIGIGSMRAKLEDGWGYIITPGQWVIRYFDNGVIRQKHALHNLGELEDADDDTIWSVMKKLAEGKQYSYTTKPRPATLLESYQLKVEPGTLVSHTQVVSLHKEDELHNPTRTQRMLQQTNNRLASASEHKLGTTETAQGCIKILASYGLTYDEISIMSRISVDSIKSIATGRKSGTKSLEKLWQLVHEQEMLINAS